MKWVKFSERLPEVGRFVIVKFNDLDAGFGFFTSQKDWNDGEETLFFQPANEDNERITIVESLKVEWLDEGVFGKNEHEEKTNDVSEESFNTIIGLTNEASDVFTQNINVIARRGLNAFGKSEQSGIPNKEVRFATANDVTTDFRGNECARKAATVSADDHCGRCGDKNSCPYKETEMWKQRCMAAARRVDELEKIINM